MHLIPRVTFKYIKSTIQIPAIEEIHILFISKLCKYNIFSVDGDRALSILNNTTQGVFVWNEPPLQDMSVLKGKQMRWADRHRQCCTACFYSKSHSSLFLTDGQTVDLKGSKLSSGVIFQDRVVSTANSLPHHLSLS